jgi:hypothetical protein
LVGCGATRTSISSSAVSAAKPILTPTATASPDVAGARSAALTIYFSPPGQTPEVWFPCSARASNFADCPFSTTVIDGLNHLTASGFGGDATGCGEDYITGSQNGMFRAPQILSAVGEAGGNVTVIIQRGPQTPNFTATMTRENGQWLATDLASGTGPNASLFSAKPNC